jgi:hypothetical protein
MFCSKLIDWCTKGANNLQVGGHYGITLSCRSPKCQTTKCRMTKCRTTKCRTTKCWTTKCRTTKCRTTKCRTTKCRTTKCRTTKCQTTKMSNDKNVERQKCRTTKMSQIQIIPRHQNVDITNCLPYPNWWAHNPPGRDGGCQKRARLNRHSQYFSTFWKSDTWFSTSFHRADHNDRLTRFSYLSRYRAWFMALGSKSGLPDFSWCNVAKRRKNVPND